MRADCTPDSPSRLSTDVNFSAIGGNSNKLQPGRVIAGRKECGTSECHSQKCQTTGLADHKASSAHLHGYNIRNTPQRSEIYVVSDGANSVGEAPTQDASAGGTILESSRFGKASVLLLVTIRLTLSRRDVFSNCRGVTDNLTIVLRPNVCNHPPITFPITPI